MQHSTVPHASVRDANVFRPESANRQSSADEANLNNVLLAIWTAKLKLHAVRRNLAEARADLERISVEVSR